MKNFTVGLLRPACFSVCLVSMGAGMALSPVLAQDNVVGSSSTSGSNVYLDYSQTELDNAYDQGVWVSNIGEAG